MAGGHASSRVDSGSMKFRPGGASVRRSNAIPTPTRPSSSVSLTPNQSRSTSSLNRTSNAYGDPPSSSDTEAGPSTRGAIPTIAVSRPAARVNITPGISRAATHPGNPSTRPGSRNAPSNSTQAFVPPLVQSSATGSTIAAPTRPFRAANNSSTDSLGTPNFAVPSNPLGAGSSSRSTNYPGASLLTSGNDVSFPTPPTTQILSPSRSTRNHASTSIQPGLSRIENAFRLPTPPATQASHPSFPVDPDLLGFAGQAGDIPLAAEDSVDATQPLLPESIDLSQLLPGVQQLPPPPLLSEQNNQITDAEAQGTTDPGSSSKSSKRARKTATKEDKPKKRRRAARTQSESGDAQGETAAAEQSERPARRKRSGGTRGRKPKTVEEKIEAFEQQAAKAAETAENEPLDPTTATMASLCDNDIPTGRISSKFLEKGIAYVKHVEERRQRILERTAERLKKLRTSGLDPDQTQPPPVKKPEPTPVPPGAEVDEDGNPIAGPSTAPGRRELGASLSPSPEREPAPPEETFAESAAAVQVRFVNGEVVLDEDSQFYDRAGPAAQDEDAMVVVDEADSTRFSNSSSFMRKAGSRGSRWTADETELFYWCLSAFGEDYENIARYLGRTPLQCKNKTKTEDRRGNEQRITMAIKTRIPLDLEEFGRITGRDFSGPPPTIRTPVVIPRAENQEQEPVITAGKAKASSSTPAPASTPRKKGKTVSHDEEEIMTLEEYERDGKDD